MSNPAPDHRWGQSQVRAPVAREVAGGGPATAPPLGPRAPLAAVGGPPLSFEERCDAVVVGGEPLPTPEATFQLPAPPPAAAPPPREIAAPPPTAAAAPPPREIAAPVVPGGAPPEPATRRLGLLPTSPADHEGLFRGLLWVARAVKECTAAIPRLAERVGEVERRLASPPAPRPEEVARLADLEQRVQRLDALVPAPATGPTVEAQVGDLRRDLAAADRRVAALELRLAPLESLPASVEGLVARHVDRLAAETITLPADVEGVYRELDSVAEVMAARHAEVTGRLERIEGLEAAVCELRDRVGRFVDELDADAEAAAEPGPPAAAAEPGPVGRADTDDVHPAAEPPPARPESPDGARRVLEVLTSELERIRQSIDLLVLDRAAPSPADEATRG